MQKIVIPVIALFIMSACNQLNSKGEKTVKEGDDTVASMDISVSKLDALTNLVEEEEQRHAKEHKLLFTAHGSEPGWYAQFYSDKLKLVVDYGKDSLLIEDTFENLDDAKGYNYSKAKSENGEKYALTIAIANTPCVYTASGDKEDRNVTVKLNSKIYKGCGSFAK
jgi:uncharacterized membrane protein